MIQFNINPIYIMDSNYLGGKDASQLLGVHQKTLHMWDEKGKIETIRTPGGKRLYNVKKFISDQARVHLTDDFLTTIEVNDLEELYKSLEEQENKLQELQNILRESVQRAC